MNKRTLLLLLLSLTLSLGLPARAEDVSAPPILQWFEATYDTINRRSADLFYVGYGQLWVPPPSRADSGNQSVGYDVYDRFDLGSARNETLYGTRRGLKSLVNQVHQASVAIYTDMILNHAGFSDLSTVDTKGTGTTVDDVTFAEAGGYPGLAITLPGDIDGDFHGAFESGDLNERLAGLVDIAQEKSHPFIRHPVAVANPNNIPAGTAEAFGRIANVPDSNNAQYYPDQASGGVVLDVDPGPGQSLITRYDFNLTTPLAGDATLETAEQLLMRHAQWMIQVIGVDGFRLDAVKHFPQSTLTQLDQAVFRASNQIQHDGTIKPIFSFSEVFDGSHDFVNGYVNKGLENPAAIDPGDFEVRGNRDALDFPLFFALRDNLTSNGAQNNWHHIRGASLDTSDIEVGEVNGNEVWASNGSRGVSFVQSHDEFGPALQNVAYAYTLMRPGNAVVYFNAKEFGPDRDFPRDGKLDALGGFYGDTISRLVDIRNSHGRGTFRERWLDDAFNPNGFSNIYVYERANSVVVGLNSRNDSFIETRNGVQTEFSPGTILMELTGNAVDPAVDPGGMIPETIKVNGSGQIDISIPANSGHGRGYVIYGVAPPQGTLNLTNVSMTLSGATPSAGNNGTARLGDIRVIRTDSFDVQLGTTPVSLIDPDTGQLVRDFHGDGDRAVLRMDEGIDLNATAGIDFQAPGTVTYGFENFTDTSTPGYIDDGSGTNIGSGSGTYAQMIDATGLSEGRHYITARAFRHRDSGTGGDGGPVVFTDFKQAVYIDRLPPEAAVVSFDPFASDPLVLKNRDLIVESTDQTADNMHIFLDLPAGISDSAVLQMALGGQNDAGEYDRDQWIRGFFNVTTGNHVATVVTFEPTFVEELGGFNVQRFAGLATETGLGVGFGDLDADNLLEVTDLLGLGNGSFEDVLDSQNNDFNAAADVDGNGLVDNRDLFLLEDKLILAGAGQSVLDAYDDLLVLRADVTEDGQTNDQDVVVLYAAFGQSGWSVDLNVDGVVDLADVETLVDDLVRTSRADFDLNRTVAGDDFLIWQRGYGTGSRFDQGDSDLNGVVDQPDLATWKNQFGTVGPLLSAGLVSMSIPEPSAVVLAAFAMLTSGFTWRRRRSERQWEDG